MESIRQYILSVICVSVVCGLIQILFAKGTLSNLVKWITGLAVMITVICPLLRDSLWQWDTALDNIRFDSREHTLLGQTYAEEAVSEIILEKTEAYILNKAAALGVEVGVEVQLREAYPNVPESVRLKGAVSPYIRKQLTQSLEQDLGIAEENVIWN